MAKYKHGRKIVLLYWFCIILFFLSIILYTLRGTVEKELWLDGNI